LEPEELEEEDEDGAVLVEEEEEALGDVGWGGAGGVLMGMTGVRVGTWEA